MLPYLDAAFTISRDEDPVILICGHGAHHSILVVFELHRELAQETSVAMDGPGIDEPIHAAAQQGGCVRQARPGLQEDYLRTREVGPAQQGSNRSIPKSSPHTARVPREVTISTWSPIPRRPVGRIPVIASLIPSSDKERHT